MYVHALMCMPLYKLECQLHCAAFMCLHSCACPCMSLIPGFTMCLFTCVSPSERVSPSFTVCLSVCLPPYELEPQVRCVSFHLHAII